MALCRHTLEYVLLFDCAGHMQTLSRLTKLLDQHSHSQILIAGFYFHIISILFSVFICVCKGIGNEEHVMCNFCNTMMSHVYVCYLLV